MANASLNVYRVTYHFEKSGKKCSDVFQDNVAAADSSFATISAVLSGNSKTNQGQGTIQIVSVGAGLISNILT